MLGHELENQLCDFVSLFVECEVPGVKQMDVRIRKVLLEGFGTRCDKGRIVRDPCYEGWELVLSEPSLSLGV
jgi:hypothetical protein